ncbi:MAG: VanZ family protein [Clostridiales bacterium]|nr:VanZ family protein [Clostridiales bacterium]
MADRKKDYAVVLGCALLTFLSAAAIIGLSGQDSGQSHALSKGLTAWILSFLPLENTPENLEFLNFILRKLAHFGLYFLLGVGLTGLVQGRWKAPTVLIVILLGGLFAASDEFHQRFSQGRSPSGWDVLLDTCGVAAGWGVFQGQKWLKKRWDGRR